MSCHDRNPHHPWYASMIGWPVLLALFATAALAQPAGGRVQVVYHLDDSARAIAALRSIENHLRAAPATRVVVVTLADGVGFLTTGAQDPRGNPYEPMIDDLVATGVEFRACNNTLVARQIPRSRLHPDVTVVESGVAEIARLQAFENFVYLKP